MNTSIDYGQKIDQPLFKLYRLGSKWVLHQNSPATNIIEME